MHQLVFQPLWPYGDVVRGLAATVTTTIQYRLHPQQKTRRKLQSRKKTPLSTSTKTCRSGLPFFIWRKQSQTLRISCQMVGVQNVSRSWMEVLDALASKVGMDSALDPWFLGSSRWRRFRFTGSVLFGEIEGLGLKKIRATIEDYQKTSRWSVKYLVKNPWGWCR